MKIRVKVYETMRKKKKKSISNFKIFIEKHHSNERFHFSFFLFVCSHKRKILQDSILELTTLYHLYMAGWFLLYFICCFSNSLLSLLLRFQIAQIFNHESTKTCSQRNNLSSKDWHLGKMKNWEKVSTLTGEQGVPLNINLQPWLGIK